MIGRWQARLSWVPAVRQPPGRLLAAAAAYAELVAQGSPRPVPPVPPVAQERVSSWGGVAPSATSGSAPRRPRAPPTEGGPVRHVRPQPPGRFHSTPIVADTEFTTDPVLGQRRVTVGRDLHLAGAVPAVRRRISPPPCRCRGRYRHQDQQPDNPCDPNSHRGPHSGQQPPRLGRGHRPAVVSGFECVDDERGPGCAEQRHVRMSRSVTLRLYGCRAMVTTAGETSSGVTDRERSHER